MNIYLPRLRHGGVLAAISSLLFVPRLMAGIVPLAEALDASGLAWTTNSPGWYGQTDSSHDGLDAAQSGPISHNQQSLFQTTVTGPGTLTFWWKVSSETNADFLRFYVGAAQVTNVSGETGWRQETVALSAGSKMLRWTFAKNGNGTAGADAAWVDEVHFESVLPFITRQPASQTVLMGADVALSVEATGPPPLSYQWRFNGIDLPSGSNALLTLPQVSSTHRGDYTVVVANSFGAVTSAVARLTVSENIALLLLDHPWKYNQSGADLGSGWKETNYNDSAWPSGRGVLAQENHAVVNPLTNTVLSLTNASGARIITYYFRTTFTVTNPAEIALLTLTNLIDDGCVVYLNGRELYRINLNDGPVDASWLAANATEGVFIVNSVPANGLLVAGTNLLAVEVHQTSTTSSDVVMGLSLNANRWNLGPVVIVKPPQNQTVNPGGSAEFSVQASSSAPVSYQWRFNGVEIAGATSANLTLPNISLLQAGFYWAVVSNGYGAVVSSPARLRVAASGLMPFYQTDFDDGAGAEWSNTRTETTPLGAQRFLGQFANQTTSLRLVNLPPHSNIVVSLDLFIIQTWNGNGTAEPEPGPDFWRLGVAGGSTVLYTTFKGYSTSDSPYDSTQAFPDRYPNGKFPGMTGADETNTLGYLWEGSSMDTVYRRLTCSIPHSVGAAQLDFSGSGLQGIGDESWGLDNVQVYLDNGTVAGWPIMVAHPQSQAVAAGGSVTFSVSAGGVEPLSYQWCFNGTNIPSATGATLTLSNVQAAQLGSYSVVVSNAYGAAVSGTAELCIPLNIYMPAGGLTLSNGLLRLPVVGAHGNQVIVLETSTNLVDWEPVATNDTPSVSFDWWWPVTDEPQRFFRAQAWDVLFDGSSLAALEAADGGAFPTQSWAVVNGDLSMIVTGPSMGFRTRAVFTNFVLTLEWAADSVNANSGVFYRVADGFPGPEFQLVNNAGYPAYGPTQVAGAVYALYAPSNAVLRPLGQFNAVKLVVRGNQVEHWLNGERVVTCELGSADFNQRVTTTSVADFPWRASPTFGQAPAGHLAFQFHNGENRYRNIRILPLPAP